MVGNLKVDEAGNSSHCLVNLEITDYPPTHDPGPLWVVVKTEDNKVVIGTKVALNSYHCYDGPLNLEMNILYFKHRAVIHFIIYPSQAPIMKSTHQKLMNC